MAVRSKKTVKQGGARKVNRSNSAATNGRDERLPYPELNPQDVARIAAMLFNPPEAVFGDRANFEASPTEDSVQLNGTGDRGNPYRDVLPRLHQVECYCQALADRMRHLEDQVTTLMSTIGQFLRR